MKRGTATKKQCDFVGLWVPKALTVLLDKGVSKRDTDRSKFVREAIREKLGREMGAAR